MQAYERKYKDAEGKDAAKQDKAAFKLAQVTPSSWRYFVFQHAKSAGRERAQGWEGKGAELG